MNWNTIYFRMTGNVIHNYNQFEENRRHRIANVRKPHTYSLTAKAVAIILSKETLEGQPDRTWRVDLARIHRIGLRAKWWKRHSLSWTSYLLVLRRR